MPFSHASTVCSCIAASTQVGIVAGVAGGAGLMFIIALIVIAIIYASFNKRIAAMNRTMQVSSSAKMMTTFSSGGGSARQPKAAHDNTTFNNPVYSTGSIQYESPEFFDEPDSHETNFGQSGLARKATLTRPVDVNHYEGEDEA